MLLADRAILASQTANFISQKMSQSATFLGLKGITEDLGAKAKRLARRQRQRQRRLEIDKERYIERHTHNTRKTHWITKKHDEKVNFRGLSSTAPLVSDVV